MNPFFKSRVSAANIESKLQEKEINLFALQTILPSTKEAM